MTEKARSTDDTTVLTIMNGPILEAVMDRGVSVIVQPYPLHLAQLAQRAELHKFSMGMALSPYMVTINSDNVLFWRRKQVPFIMMLDYEADMDGNEVEVWVEATYEIANRFQFHQTNHLHIDIACKCGVTVIRTDDEGRPTHWRISLKPTDV